MRFSLHTSDGLGFVIKDRGKVFARGVLAGQISKAIEKRKAGDEWRQTYRDMCSAWRGHVNRFYNPNSRSDEWGRWADNRRVSWNCRGRAMVNALNRGSWCPTGGLHVRKQAKVATTWEQAFKRMASTYISQWSKQDEWSKWATNTASNQRKRIRRKAERAEGEHDISAGKEAS